MDKKERVIITKGEKVALIIPEKQDIKIFYKGNNDPEIARSLGGENNIRTYKKEEEDFEKLKDNQKYKLFSIMLLNNNKVIGNVDLESFNPIDNRAQIGIVIFDKKHYNKGYGSEAMRLMLDYGFRVQNYRKIVLYYFEFNSKVRGLYDKLGFKEVGRYKQHIFTNGGFHDEIIMEIFKDEFYEKNPEFLK